MTEPKMDLFLILTANRAQIPSNKIKRVANIAAMQKLRSESSSYYYMTGST